jgi:hypothetical protein
MGNKVFRTEQALDFMLKKQTKETLETLYLIHQGWIDKCEGKTEEEINAMGFITRPEFMRGGDNL